MRTILRMMKKISVYPKIMQPTLLYKPTTSKTDVGGLKVIEPFHHHHYYHQQQPIFLSCYGHQLTKLAPVTFHKCVRNVTWKKTAFLTSIELITIHGNKTLNVSTVSDTVMWCMKSDVYCSQNIPLEKR